MHHSGLVSGWNYMSNPSRGYTQPRSVMILSPFPFWLSSSSSLTCWEWPGSVYLVFLRCPCLCATPYGQPVKSSNHPRPMELPVWSRSAWISGNRVLPFTLPTNLYPLIHMSGPQLLHGCVLNHCDWCHTFFSWYGL